MERSEQLCPPEHEANRRLYELRYTAPDRVHISTEPQQLLVVHDFESPIEIRLDPEVDEVQRLFLVKGDKCPQLGARYVLVQPGVVACDPRRGWLPLGGVHGNSLALGREDSPELELHADVDPDHAFVSLTEEGIWISDGSEAGTDVWADPDSVLRHA